MTKLNNNLYKVINEACSDENWSQTKYWKVIAKLKELITECENWDFDKYQSIK